MYAVTIKALGTGVAYTPNTMIKFLAKNNFNKKHSESANLHHA